LKNLLEIYWEGLSRPLPLFPRASWAYMQAIRAGKTEAKVLEAVRQAWDNEYNGGDRTDPYLARCFRETDPLEQPDFLPLTEAVMGPLWKNENGRP
jgi:exodeoxyribonuclease V gamma subunit